MSSSPPSGEPGQDTLESSSSGTPELLLSLFPPADSTGPAAAPRRRRRPAPALPVLAALIALVLMTGVVVAADQGGSAGAAAAATAGAALAPPPAVEDLPVPPPPTTVTTVAPAAPARRTAPVPPPANPTAPAPIVKIGEIRIPKIGLVHPIYEGVTLTVIDHGPGHWPGSAMPGQLGNAVFAGHRVTHTHPFRNVDQLVSGDEIQFVMPDGTYTYRMTRQQIVNPNDTWIVNPTPNATVTLFACHPPGSAAHRIVIRGEYVGKT